MYYFSKGLADAQPERREPFLVFLVVLSKCISFILMNWFPVIKMCAGNVYTKHTKAVFCTYTNAV